MTRYKNIELDPKLAAVIRHMNAVEEYREVLQNLQTVWDNLTLLGQLSGTGTDMSNTRQAFNQLTGSLLNQLGSETLRKCVLEMTAKGQVAIDILVRNLFERTADIGFLATDDDIRAFIAEACDAAGNFRAERELRPQREALKQRFAEYVAKYSVYADIVLLDPDGRVLIRLDDKLTVERTSAALVRESLETDGAYVETYGPLDLLPQQANALVYSYRVREFARLLNDPDLTARTEALIAREEARADAALAPWRERLKGKRVLLYTGGVKSWSIVSALQDLGMTVVATGTKKSTEEDKARIRELMGPDVNMIDDGSPKALLGAYKDLRADILIAGGRNLYTALKARIPFLDINQEREFGYAGYAGMEELARQLALTMESPVWEKVRKPAPWASKQVGTPVTA